MAQDNETKQHIRIHVYDEDFDIAVRPEDEPLYRKAAKFITERYNRYAENFKGHKSDHTIALMTLIDIALLYEMEIEKNDVSPYDDTMKRLIGEIDKVLGGK
ncbi:MAG: cell division protein ZapA [Prevotella sp.]